MSYYGQKKTPRNYRLPDDVFEELKNHSEEHHVTQTAIIVEALKYYFKSGLIHSISQTKGKS